MRMMTKIHPYGSKIAVVDSPAKDETMSGLILPVGVDEYSVGVVCDGGTTDIPDGSLVYYHKGHGIEIKDVRIVNTDCIIAWEEA